MPGALVIAKEFAQLWTRLWQQDAFASDFNMNITNQGRRKYALHISRRTFGVGINVAEMLNGILHREFHPPSEDSVPVIGTLLEVQTTQVPHGTNVIKVSKSAFVEAATIALQAILPRPWGWQGLATKLSLTLHHLARQWFATAKTVKTSSTGNRADSAPQLQGQGKAVCSSFAGISRRLLWAREADG